MISLIMIMYWVKTAELIDDPGNYNRKKAQLKITNIYINN